MVHFLVDPARRAGVACVAVHSCAVEQLRLRDVVARLSQGPLGPR
jgi:hypothetical protein